MVNLFNIIILIYYSSVSRLFIRFLSNLSYLFVSRSIVASIVVKFGAFSSMNERVLDWT